jgi:CRISPR-associated endoribonuclease Cas6
MEAPREKLSFSFDQDYVSRRGGFGRVSRLEEYKGTKIKSWQAPFMMAGDPVLLQVGWECGFGEANSKGFGMVQAAPIPEL